MKDITLQEAKNLIYSCAAVIIDNVVTYPITHFDEIQNDISEIFVEFVWEDDFNSFGAVFFEDCNPKFDGTHLYLTDEDGDVSEITLLVPMKSDNS